MDTNTKDTKKRVRGSPVDPEPKKHKPGAGSSEDSCSSSDSILRSRPTGYASSPGSSPAHEVSHNLLEMTVNVAAGLELASNLASGQEEVQVCEVSHNLSEMTVNAATGLEPTSNLASGQEEVQVHAGAIGRLAKISQSLKQTMRQVEELMQDLTQGVHEAVAQAQQGFNAAEIQKAKEPAMTIKELKEALKQEAQAKIGNKREYSVFKGKKERILWKLLDINEYPSIKSCVKIANALNTEPEKVLGWFERERSRDKKPPKVNKPVHHVPKKPHPSPGALP